MTDDLEKDLPAEAEATPEESSGEAGVDNPGEQAGEESSSPAAENRAEDDLSELEQSMNADENVVNEGDASEDDAEEAMLKMLADLPEENGKVNPDDINFGPSVSDAEFQQLQQPVSNSEAKNIDLLLDVDLPVSIELGRTKLSISDILSLGPGSVVELNKLAGEPVDLLVNNKVVAKGEVVVVDENFGLRITQLITPEERLKALAQE